MSNYDIDEIERTERYERFEHALNCMDISPVTMMTIERVAKQKKISLKYMLESWLLDSLDRELSKDEDILELSFREGRYG